MHKRIISTGVKLVFTVGLFVLLFRPQTFWFLGFTANSFGGVTPLKMWHELQAANLSSVAFWIGLAIFIKLSGMLAGVIRWRILLRGQGLHIPFWYMVQSWFVGRFFGIFVPGTIGLDGYRLYDSSMYTGEVIKCASVIAVEKLIGFISLTFLVFLTFPLGFRLLAINPGILGIILICLCGFVVGSFSLLLNPRVIQVLVAVVPVPAGLRSKIDKLGASITAYSGKRRSLMLAVLCGLWVHLATCLMYFCTMMSLRAPNTSLLDILFASPIMIYGTVIGPSVGGEGIREIVFAKLLGATSGVVTAVLFAHLGWWVDNVVPFLIGMPILVFRSRSAWKDMAAKLSVARQEIAAQQREATQLIHLTLRAVADYRNKLLDCAASGVAAGLIAGAGVGIAESLWLKQSLSSLPDLLLLSWGPAAYGLIFAGVGLGVAAGIAYIYLLFDKFASVPVTFGLCLGGSAFASIIIGVFRFTRDVLRGHPMTFTNILGIVGVFAAVAIAVAIIGMVLATILPKRRLALPIFGGTVFLAVIVAGTVYAVMHPVHPAPPNFTPIAAAKDKPNIILVAEDALRADYLKMYSKDAVANSPNLDAFKKDAVFFSNWFSQASWTKPSFGTIFSGRYPECHTATTKERGLPDIATFPKLLREAGYFTKGFANNGNIYSLFNFNQGFSDYVDLQPRRLFLASESASRLSVYDGLRKAYNVVMSKITKKMNVLDFDQPADVITKTALDWIDGEQRPKDAPFFLFLHYMDTHDPFMDHNKPGVGYARVRNDKPDAEKFLEPMKAAYNSDIEYLDKYLGVLFDGLKQRGLYDNTLIIFTSDHGEEFFDHGGWWHGQTLYDELVHVPMMIKSPKNQGAGEVNGNFGRHIDIAPTVLQFAGVTPAKEMVGKAIVAPDGKTDNADILSVYAENDFENNILQSFRTKDAKDIHANPGNPRGHAPVSIFNLREDPAEKKNLVENDAPLKSNLEQALSQMISATQSCVKAEVLQPKLSTDADESLQGLGYMGVDKKKK